MKKNSSNKLYEIRISFSHPYNFGFYNDRPFYHLLGTVDILFIY